MRQRLTTRRTKTKKEIKKKSSKLTNGKEFVKVVGAAGVSVSKSPDLNDDEYYIIDTGTILILGEVEEKYKKNPLVMEGRRKRLLCGGYISMYDSHRNPLCEIVKDVDIPKHAKGIFLNTLVEQIISNEYTGFKLTNDEVILEIERLANQSLIFFYPMGLINGVLLDSFVSLDENIMRDQHNIDSVALSKNVNKGLVNSFKSEGLSFNPDASNGTSASSSTEMVENSLVQARKMHSYIGNRIDIKILEKQLNAVEASSLPYSSYTYYHILTHLNLNLDSRMNNYLNRTKFQIAFGALINGEDKLIAVDRTKLAAEKKTGLSSLKTPNNSVKWGVSVEHLWQYIILASEETYLGLLTRFTYSYISNPDVFNRLDDMRNKKIQAISTEDLRHLVGKLFWIDDITTELFSLLSLLVGKMTQGPMKKTELNESDHNPLNNEVSEFSV